MEKIFDRVKFLLTLNPKYRDNDKALIARYWWDEMKADGIDVKAQRMLVEDFLNMYLQSLTDANTISRARRKVQEEIVELRGVTWKERQVHKTAEVKEQIRNLTFDKL